MKFDQFKVNEQLKFGEYKKGIALSMQDGSPIYLAIPRVCIPFGISAFPSSYGPMSYSIDLSLKGWNTEGRVQKFYNFIQQVED